MSDVLQAILGRKREEVIARSAQAPLAALEEQLAGAPAVRGFEAALRQKIEAGKAAVAKGTGKGKDKSQNSEIGRLKRELDEHKRVIGELTIANSILKKLGEDPS